MQSTWKQILLITLGIGLVAFIFFQGKNNPSVLIEKDRKITAEGNDVSAFNIDLVAVEAKQIISDSIKLQLEEAEQKLAENENDTIVLLSIGKVWEDAGFPALAATYYERYARIKDTERAYLLAANEYFEAQKIAEDSSAFQFLSNKSISLFEEVLDRDPGNLNVKADLAVSYIEARGEVMKGVGLLKEVEQVDPENKKALFYLAMLSIRSGQNEKAKDRLLKLAELQPDNAFIYRYLGQVYLSLNQKEKAVEAFETYKERIKDPALKEEAGRVIESLKN